MRRLAAVALLGLAACNSSNFRSGSEEEEDPGPAAPAERIPWLRARIARKDAELAELAREREQVRRTTGASKSGRLSDFDSEIASTRADKRDSEAELARLEGPPPAALVSLPLAPPIQPRPRTADEALELALEEDRRRDQARAASLASAAEAQRRLAEAERRRVEQEKTRARETVEGAGPAAGDDLSFEEKWADALLKLRIELQKYKRW